MAQLQAADLTSFRSSFTGQVIGPEDADYAQACSLWNGDIQRHPAVIARCSSTADVVAALAFGRANGLEITIRGGGHNYAGHAIWDDGLMIDLSGMRNVSVDAANRRAVCGGGCTWADVDAATQEHGLAVPGGFISHTGIGGLTLGGGIGWLTRHAGLTADNLVGAEVVTADGRVVHTSKDENPDLLWALSGGGGNFGVVTAFEYQLHPVGPLVNLGLFFWAADRGQEALKFAREYVETVPENYGVFIIGLNAPPEPFVPAEYHFQPGYAVLATGFGSAEEHAAVTAPILEKSPNWHIIAPMPYTALQQMFNAAAPWGIRAYEKALFLDELTDPVIDIFTDFLPRKQSPMTIVPLFHLAGAYRNAEENATAWGGRRSAHYVFNISAASPDPEVLAADRTWVREFWDALRPHAESSSGYVNFMVEADEDRVRATYGAKYDRLAAIKAQWDPENVFHHNVNIKPAR